MHAAYFVKCELLNVGLLLQAAIQLHSSSSSAVDSVSDPDFGFGITV